MARGQVREQAIIDACLRVLAAVGYRALTVDAVAAEAHASKTTIYRRWSNKAELVKAALDAQDVAFNAAMAQVGDTGNLRDDLLAVVEALREKAAAFPVALYVEFTQLMSDDPELADALRRHLSADQLSPLHHPVARARARGEIGDEVDGGLLHDVTEAMIVHRVQLGQPVDRAFAARVVDDVLMPIIGSAGPGDGQGSRRGAGTPAPGDRSA